CSSSLTGWGESNSTVPLPAPTEALACAPTALMSATNTFEWLAEGYVAGGIDARCSLLRLVLTCVTGARRSAATSFPPQRTFRASRGPRAVGSTPLEKRNRV